MAEPCQPASGPTKNSPLTTHLNTYVSVLVWMRDRRDQAKPNLNSKLNASRDRGQYDCYITAIEIGNKIGNNEEI
jgi:hypothetical protein